MTIKADAVVSIDYTLKNDAGEVLDSSEAGSPLDYLHGHRNIVPGLEAALSGKSEGDTVKVSVPPSEGYGERDPERIFEVARDRLPDGLDPKVGTMLGMQTPEGHTLPLTITKVTPDLVTVDANHQLAGQTLHFEVNVRGVRDATAEELAHGHVHGPGGH
ncbi:MAG: peptidylprolyl isomerase [Myxococcales bacterium]|jgi:FKBP-type peptidyl-prolyl cis-trans isomerase SlyD